MFFVGFGVGPYVAFAIFLFFTVSSMPSAVQPPPSGPQMIDAAATFLVAIFLRKTDICLLHITLICFYVKTAKQYVFAKIENTNLWNILQSSPCKRS